MNKFCFIMKILTWGFPANSRSAIIASKDHSCFISHNTDLIVFAHNDYVELDYRTHLATPEQLSVKEALLGICAGECPLIKKIVFYPNYIYLVKFDFHRWSTTMHLVERALKRAVPDIVFCTTNRLLPANA